MAAPRGGRAGRRAPLSRTGDGGQAEKALILQKFGRRFLTTGEKYPSIKERGQDALGKDTESWKY